MEAIFFPALQDTRPAPTETGCRFAKFAKLTAEPTTAPAAPHHHRQIGKNTALAENHKKGANRLRKSGVKYQVVQVFYAGVFRQDNTAIKVQAGAG